MYEEKLKRELRALCDAVEHHYRASSWAPLNQLTVMITANTGDVQPFQYLADRQPGAVWMAVRVLAALETARERPMYISYIMVGRIGVSSQVIGVLDAGGQWRQVFEGAPTDHKHCDVMIEQAGLERDKLLARLTPEISRLR